MTSPLSGQFPGHLVSYFHLDLNEKRRQEKKRGSQILDWMYARGGGGHSDAYCVQQGGRGGLKFGKKCVCN